MIQTTPRPDLLDVVDAAIVPDSSLPSDSGIVDAVLLPPLPPVTFAVPNSQKWRPKSWPVRLWHGLWWFGAQITGWVSFMVALAIIATVPIVGLISLGYLFESSGRIARTGRLRDGFIDLEKWSRVGSLFIGTWAMLLPLRFLATWANDAAIVEVGATSGPVLRFLLLVCTVLMMGHIALAWYSGGKIRDFLWPLLAPFSLMQWLVTGKVIGPLTQPLIRWVWPSLAEDLKQPDPLTQWFPPAILLAGLWRGPSRMYAEARDAVWDFIMSLELPHYFWLGLRGFVGSVIWLLLPVLLLYGAVNVGDDGLGAILALAGFPAMTFVLLYLPFLQAHFAAENRFTAIFEVRRIRYAFRRAPARFVLATLVTLGLSIPPLFLKIQPPFPELFWILGLVMVMFVYPGRLLTGWAVGAGRRREKPAWGFLFRWSLFRPLMVALCLFYVIVLFFSQFTSWNGSSTLLEQPAFLIPTPFLRW